MDRGRASREGRSLVVTPELPLREPYRCAHIEGFSLHADVDIVSSDREGLLRLTRYPEQQLDLFDSDDDVHDFDSEPPREVMLNLVESG